MRLLRILNIAATSPNHCMRNCRIRLFMRYQSVVAAIKHQQFGVRWQVFGTHHPWPSISSVLLIKTIATRPYWLTTTLRNTSVGHRPHSLPCGLWKAIHIRGSVEFQDVVKVRLYIIMIGFHLAIVWTNRVKGRAAACCKQP